MTEVAQARSVSSVGALSAAADAEKGRVFPCEQCGADLVFHIGAQSLRCEFCGFTRPLADPEGASIAEKDLGDTLRRLAARRVAATKPEAAVRELRCESCAATVVFTGTLTSTSCGYCGAPVQLADAHAARDDRLPVDAVLTFAVEAADAQGRVRRWARSRWFAPNEFTRHGVEGRLEGAYLPYFSFDAMTSTHYRGQRGDHYWVTAGDGNDRRRERRTRWQSASGFLQRFFDDVLVPAVRALPEKVLLGLEPWPLARAVPFTPDALAGKRAHSYDVELEAAFGRARERIEAAIADDVRRDIGGDAQRITAMRTAYSALMYKHVLLPAWLLAYRFRGKVYRLAVNACTGEVRGERPYSAVKIAFAVVIGLLAAIAVALLSSQ